MTEVKAKLIHGVSFDISQPYAEGQTLTAAEAKALNQVRSENIGNNVREKIKALLDAGDTAGATALVAERDAEYVFTLANVSAAQKLDPIEKEARAIAKEIVKAKLADKGLKFTVAPEGTSKDEWAEKMEANVAKIASTEAVIKEATKNIKAKKNRLESLGEGIEL